MVRKSSAHHTGRNDDEKNISKCLRAFRREDRRKFESLSDISCNPIHSFDKDKSRIWIAKHKNNIMHYPALDDLEQSAD